VFWKTVFKIQDLLGERNDAAARKARERMAEMRGLTTKA
jgi:hypothetical protein